MRSKSAASTSAMTRRQRPLQLIECRAGLKRRHGVDEIGDGFRLRKIDPAVEKRAQRELARLGEARAAGHGRSDDGAQNDRASMRAQLDNILAGVRMRPGKIGRDDVIDRVRHGPAKAGHEPRLLR